MIQKLPHHLSDMTEGESKPVHIHSPFGGTGSSFFIEDMTGRMSSGVRTAAVNI